MIGTGPDYYAVLQVTRDAEQEIIDAAYRQLMRKYHPDLAGGDPRLSATLNERAKQINQAYAVLKDPRQRQAYDQTRFGSAKAPGTPQTPRPPAAAASGSKVAASGSAQRKRPPQAPPSAAAAGAWNAPASASDAGGAEATWYGIRPWWVVNAPLNMLESAYYLLPGPYEWEPAGKREQLFTLLISPVGVVSWMAITGRLTPILGRSGVAALGVLVVGALLLIAADWRSMPRFAFAGGLALLLATGLIDAHLIDAGIPLWLGWVAVGGLGMVLAARAFFFGLLPTMGLCWLLGHVG